jgi:hypothetical protein
LGEAQAFIVPSLKGLCLLHPQFPALKRWAIFKDFPGIFVLPRHPQRLALRYIQRTFAESPRSIDNKRFAHTPRVPEGRKTNDDKRDRQFFRPCRDSSYLYFIPSAKALGYFTKLSQTAPGHLENIRISAQRGDEHE